MPARSRTATRSRCGTYESVSGPGAPGGAGSSSGRSARSSATSAVRSSRLQTRTYTGAPGLVTRRASVNAASGSAAYWELLKPVTASNERSSKGRNWRSPTSNRPLGTRRRIDARDPCSRLCCQQAEPARAAANVEHSAARPNPRVHDPVLEERPAQGLLIVRPLLGPDAPQLALDSCRAPLLVGRCQRGGLLACVRAALLTAPVCLLPPAYARCPPPPSEQSGILHRVPRRRLRGLPHGGRRDTGQRFGCGAKSAPASERKPSPRPGCGRQASRRCG